MKIDIGAFCMDCKYELNGTAGIHDDGKYSLGFRCDHCGYVLEVRIWNRGSELDLE